MSYSIISAIQCFEHAYMIKTCSFARRESLGPRLSTYMWRDGTVTQHSREPLGRKLCQAWNLASTKQQYSLTFLVSIHQQARVCNSHMWQSRIESNIVYFDCVTTFEVLLWPSLVASLATSRLTSGKRQLIYYVWRGRACWGGKIIRFICGKSICGFPLFQLADFCNLLYLRISPVCGLTFGPVQATNTSHLTSHYCLSLKI